MSTKHKTLDENFDAFFREMGKKGADWRYKLTEEWFREDAKKVYRTLRTLDKIKEFSKLDMETQNKKVPGLSAQCYKENFIAHVCFVAAQYVLQIRKQTYTAKLYATKRLAERQ